MLMNYHAMSHIIKSFDDVTLEALLERVGELSEADIQAMRVEAEVDDWIDSDFIEVVCGSV